MSRLVLMFSMQKAQFGAERASLEKRSRSTTSHNLPIQQAAMNTHDAVLRETKDLQQASLASVQRMRYMASESKCLAGNALQNLHDQGTKLQKLEASTMKHNETLKVASKLQDKFARAKFHFGTKNKARKDIKKEKKLDDKLNAVTDGTQSAPTFKRRGPRPKKNSNTDIPPNNDPNRDELFSNHKVAKEKKNRVHRDRKELFSDRSNRGKSIAKAPPGVRGAPLTRQEKQALNEIQDTDQLLEEGLTALEEELSDMRIQATMMGTVVEDHNNRLDRINERMEDSKWKTKELQNRLTRLSKQKPKRKKKRPIRGMVVRSMTPI